MQESQQYVTERLLDLTRNRYFGKYRGEVVDNNDPEQRGRIEVVVPCLLDEVSLWAMPCVPFAGNGMGSHWIPANGSGVWVEFEGGNLSFPIWTGCYWGSEESPASTPEDRLLYSEKGLQISLHDQQEKITISDKNSGNMVTIDVLQGKVKVKGNISVVIEAPSVQLGGEGAVSPVVKGTELMAYLTSLAAAAMPKTPATPPLPPPPTILSTKVKTA